MASSLAWPLLLPGGALWWWLRAVVLVVCADKNNYNPPCPLKDARGGRWAKRTPGAGLLSQRGTCPEKMPGGGVPLFKMPGRGPPIKYMGNS